MYQMFPGYHLNLIDGENTGESPAEFNIRIFFFDSYVRTESRNSRQPMISVSVSFLYLLLLLFSGYINELNRERFTDIILKMNMSRICQNIILGCKNEHTTMIVPSVTMYGDLELFEWSTKNFRGVTIYAYCSNCFL